MTTVNDKVAVRERLVDTAARLFYERGYTATGINEVIKEAGVAKASFYHHFPTKEDLLVKCLEVRHDRMMNEVRAFVGQGSTAGQKIARVFEWLGGICGCSKSHGCAYLNMVSEFHDAGSRVREFVRWHKKTFRGFLLELLSAHNLTAGVKGRKLDEEQLEEAADELYLLTEAVFASSPVHQCTWPSETAFRLANDRFGLV